MMLEVKDGTFAYDSKDVFKSIQMTAQDHDVYAVLGRNGAGKTTLLKCIMGMLPWKSGAAYLDGVDTKHIPHKKFWQQVSYVPQAKATSDLPVRNMVVMGRSAHIGLFGKPSEADYAIADSILQKLEIEHLAQKPCNELSGGELQLVLIGRALAVQPNVIIMDEPESNLDYHNQLHVLKLISDLAQDSICILNTHYPEHALQYANKSLLLFPDGTALAGPTEEVVTANHLQEAFGISVHIGHDTINNQTYKYI
ncbi:MAG: ABC transporter ATP-binding protein, partial [Coriobacteriales bacterium]|nr:ABC transporter ATP-binding protein [Coriobacteriales bacterium]